jgi:CO/xanthine dehydrogenase Mo-binding subunit
MYEEYGKMSVNAKAQRISHLGIVGDSASRVDAREKVRGEPLYYGDLEMPGLLHARVLRSRYPHARIMSIDASRARALPGVAAVALAADVPGLKVLGRGGDQPVLCSDKVRYIGDAVALVAAEETQIAASAVSLIHVAYEPLPAVFTPKEALLPGAVRVHDDRENLLRHFKLRKGDVDGAFTTCDVIVEGTYRTPTVEHAYLEVEGALAAMQPDGSITVWASTQFAAKMRDVVALALNLRPEQVRVINTSAGGGFGGKGHEFDCACRAALLSSMTGRPVRLVHGRDESMIGSSKRHATVIEYKTGANRDGRIQAAEIRVYMNKGAYGSAALAPGGAITAKTGYHASGPYAIPNVKVDVFNVYTNLPFGGAMRGFGVPQVAFAHESQMDELACRLNFDPVQIRLINGLEVGARTAYDQLLTESVGLKQCIREAANLSRWPTVRGQHFVPAIAAKDSFNPPSSTPAIAELDAKVRRGVGIACFMYSTCLNGWPDYANCTIELDSLRRFVLRTGLVEMGQGMRTVLAQIAAEALQVSLDRVIVPREGDSAADPDSMLTVASRGTLTGGNAVIVAAKEASETLLEMAADYLDIPVHAVIKIGDTYREAGGANEVGIDDLLAYCFKCGRRLLGKGWWCAPKVTVDPETGLGNVSHACAYGAQVVQVAINVATGEVTVERIVHAQDVGRAINPSAIEGQIEGAVSMGIGYALSEELVIKDGYVSNTSLANYLIPTAADMPPIETVLVEDPYSAGPFGAKGVGEPATIPTAAAVANAIYNAIGVRITELPITAERVWKALHESRTDRHLQ